MLSREEIESGVPLADELKSPSQPVWGLQGGEDFRLAWLRAPPRAGAGVRSPGLICQQAVVADKAAACAARWVSSRCNVHTKRDDMPARIVILGFRFLAWKQPEAQQRCDAVHRLARGDSIYPSQRGRRDDVVAARRLVGFRIGMSLAMLLNMSSTRQPSAQ